MEKRGKVVVVSVVSFLLFFLMVSPLNANEFVRSSEIYDDVLWVASENGFFVVYKSDPKRCRTELANILPGVIDLYEINTGQNSIMLVVFDGKKQQEFFVDEIGPFDIGTPRSIGLNEWQIKKEKARKLLNKKNLAKN
jgi:hypothetical protein